MKRKSWEKGKEKGKRKERGKKERKRHMRRTGLPKSMGRKENQKIRFKKKNGMSHNRKKKRDAEECEGKTKQNRTVTGREGEKKRVDKKRILHHQSKPRRLEDGFPCSPSLS